MKKDLPPKKILDSNGKAKSVRPGSTTRPRPRVSHSDENVFYRIREQFRMSSVGSEGPRRDSVSLASSTANDIDLQPASCYSMDERTVPMTRDWVRMKGTVEQPQPPVIPRDKSLSRAFSKSYSQRCPESSQSPALARMHSVLAPTIESQPAETQSLQGNNSRETCRSKPTRRLSRERRQSSSTSRRLGNESESRLSRVGSRRSPTVLSSREKTPFALSSQSRPIHAHVPPGPSSSPRTGLEQECLGTDLPFLDSEDSLFGDNPGLSTQRDTPDRRFMTPIVTERQAHSSDQSMLRDTITSHAGSSVSEIDDADLEELAKGEWLGRKRESKSRRDATAARRKREEEARKRKRSSGYWRQRQARRRKMQRSRRWQGKRGHRSSASHV